MSTRADDDDEKLRVRVARLLNTSRVALLPVSSNWGLTVYCAQTTGGRAAVKAGCARLAGHIETEARMLTDLAATHLPVPRIIATDSDILAMEWIEHDEEPARAIHERSAGEELAALHAVERDCFGYAYPTQIGALSQPNSASDSWIDFFRDQRLCHYAHLALEAGIIDPRFLERLDQLSGCLEQLITEPAWPSLLHGDLWTGNLLIKGSRIAAFIDPALFYGHHEYELAYATLHGTFGRPFFENYRAHLEIEPGFEDARRDIYLIVPLLQHALLSGPAYIHRIDRILSRFGI